MKKVERKFIDLKELKMTSNGPGTIEGYRSVFAIDEGGDLIVPGAFKDSIPEYLSSGFSAHSHSWGFDQAVGFPLTAKEDAHGLWVKSQFHSTPDAQSIRTKARERMEAGKQVGFSFGYSVDDYEFISAKDYDIKLPLYVKSERMEYNLAQARRFPQIRLLKKVSIIEDSLVTAPMNKLATATAIKGRSKHNISRLEINSIRIRNRALEVLALEITPGRSAILARARRALCGL
ncbi:MAG: HK97 family phage prohead protease [Pyrinomonadaceae bacterium]